MCRPLAVCSMGLLWLILLSASPARPAEDILKLVPDSALGLVVIRSPASLDTRLQELGRQMQLPIPSLLSHLTQQADIGEGLDAQAAAALVLLPPSGGLGLPTPVLLVPVTDYDKFIAPHKPGENDGGVTRIEIRGSAMWVRPIGGYAALADSSHRQALAETLRVSDRIPESLVPWGATLAQSDIAAVILQPGIKLAASLVQVQIQMAKVAMAQADEQTQQAAAVLDVYVKLFQAAEKELTGLAFSTRIDSQGVLHATKRARLVSGGSWAQMAAQVRPAAQNALAGLPAGTFVLAGGGTFPEGLWEPMMAMSIDMMKNMSGLYGLTNEQIDRMPTSALAALKQVRAGSMVLRPVAEGESLYANSIILMRVSDSDRFMADYEKSLREYGEFAKQAKSSILGATEVDKSDIDGVSALQIVSYAPQFPTVQQTPQTARMMDALFGPGNKLTAWLVPADKQVVVLGYVKKDPTRATLQMIQQGSPGLAADADVAKTAALLPADAAAVAFWSPQGTVEFANRMASVFTADGTNPQFTIPSFDKTPPIGFAITTAPDELHGHMVVPAEVLKAIGPYTGKVKETVGAER